MHAFRAVTRRATLELADLPPDSFAPVMATGIVSIASSLAGMPRVGWLLLRLNEVILLVLGGWRYLGHRLRLAYDPGYWAIVFPLGMYATCTFKVAQVMGVGFLYPLALGFAYSALLAWMLTVAWLGWRLATTLTVRRMER